MRKLIFVVLFIFPTLVFANVVWPALYLEVRLFSWWAIAVGLLVEYLFVRKLLCSNIVKAVLATVIANTASALLGYVFIPMLGFGWEITLGQLVNHLLDVGTFNPVSWGAAFLLACAVNVSIEGAVYKYVFKNGFRYKSLHFIWFLLANMASVGAALYSLRVVPLQL